MDRGARSDGRETNLNSNRIWTMETPGNCYITKSTEMTQDCGHTYLSIDNEDMANQGLPCFGMPSIKIIYQLSRKGIWQTSFGLRSYPLGSTITTFWTRYGDMRMSCQRKTKGVGRSSMFK